MQTWILGNIFGIYLCTYLGIWLLYLVETDAKKGGKSKFSPDLVNIQAKLLTHEAIILIKFHKECKGIVDFLLRQKFLACALFYASPFIIFNSFS